MVPKGNRKASEIIISILDRSSLFQLFARDIDLSNFQYDFSREIKTVG